MIKINLVSALILLNLLVLFYLIIADVFTFLLRINGVGMHKSRLSVISLITGTGFSTNESEALVLTQRRRKITQSIMLFSYAFDIIIVSTLVNLLISTSRYEY